jgi:hypothetical protein
MAIPLEFIDNCILQVINSPNWSIFGKPLIKLLGFFDILGVSKSNTEADDLIPWPASPLLWH